MQQRTYQEIREEEIRREQTAPMKRPVYYNDKPLKRAS